MLRTTKGNVGYYDSMLRAAYYRCSSGSCVVITNPVGYRTQRNLSANGPDGFKFKKTFIKVVSCMYFVLVTRCNSRRPKWSHDTSICRDTCCVSVMSLLRLSPFLCAFFQIAQRSAASFKLGSYYHRCSIQLFSPWRSLSYPLPSLQWWWRFPEEAIGETDLWQTWLGKLCWVRNWKGWFGMDRQTSIIEKPMKIHKSLRNLGGWHRIPGW